MKALEVGSGFAAVVPGDNEGSAGSNRSSDPLSSPWRPPLTNLM